MEKSVPAAAFARADLPAALRFEGHAIVTADGMIADAAGAMPKALHNAEDWRRFQAALDDSVLVVLGRLGHQRHPNPGRPRLVLTSSVAAIAPAGQNATLYNPAGASLAAVLAHLKIAAGTVAVTGGTRVFDAFLPQLDEFALAEVDDFVLPGGRPCFSSGHPRTVLAAAGLRPLRIEPIDPAAQITLTHWARPST
jgi:dihydrofolate reductase